VYDEISDYQNGTDVINFGSTAIVQFSTAVTAVAGTAGVVSGTGVVSFNSSDATLASRITAVASAMGTVAAGNALVFGLGADSYIYITDGVSGVGMNDVLIKLTGIANSALTDTLTITSGNVTGLA